MRSQRCDADLATGFLGGLLMAAGLLAGVVWLLNRRRERRSRPDRLPRLTAAIVGNTKTNVAAVLGPPRVATFVGDPTSNYQDAAVWYYPLARESRIGVAIRFGDDRAQKVEIIRGPE